MFLNEVIKTLYWLSVLMFTALVTLFLFLCVVWVGLGIMGGFILVTVAVFGR